MLIDCRILLSLTAILFHILSVSLTFNKNRVFSEPDLVSKEIAMKWRNSCGYRYNPYTRSAILNGKCFGRTEEMNITEIYKTFSTESIDNRILHGIDAESHESPWTVQLARKVYSGWIWKTFQGYSHACTGVLITMRHILTAGHCYNPDVELAIFAGHNEAFDDRYYITDKYTFYLHPNVWIEQKDGNKTFDKRHDLGVIVLDNEIDLSESLTLKDNQFVVNTICLPLEEINSRDASYKQATFFGWGDIEGNVETKKLQKADVRVRRGTTRGLCLFDYCFESEWRPGFPTGCSGDSGSGLVQYLDAYRSRALLIGITTQVRSWNKSYPSECSEGFRGETYFIKISRHTDWIKQVIHNTSV